MPSIRPSRFFSRSMMASVRAGERRKEAMNLPEPSGSSPPEKPPGSTTIWAPWMALSSSWADWSRASRVRLRTTTICASIPASMQARAVSYSQLVPGNTGITTRGRAALWPQTAAQPFSQAMGATASAVPALVG